MHGPVGSLLCPPSSRRFIRHNQSFNQPTKRTHAEEHAEAALREEVTELQAKLEASYKLGRQELALAQDKVGRGPGCG